MYLPWATVYRSSWTVVGIDRLSEIFNRLPKYRNKLPTWCNNNHGYGRTDRTFFVFAFRVVYGWYTLSDRLEKTTDPGIRICTIHVSMSGNYYVAVFKRRRPLDTGLMTNAMQIMCGRVNEGNMGFTQQYIESYQRRRHWVGDRGYLYIGSFVWVPAY